MHRRSPVCLLIAGFAAFSSPRLYAQSEIVGQVRTESGLHRALFRVPQGAISVNLPDDLAAGDMVSGTVYTDATGKNPKEVTKNSGEITGYVIEMPGQKTNASDRHFRWSVPTDVPDGASAILLLDKKNKVIGRCSVPVIRKSSGRDTAGISLPRGAQAGTMASVLGPFSGSPDSSVTVGGKNADIIAESPRKLVFQTPADVVGQTTIKVAKGNLTATGPFSSLSLQTGVTKPSLLAGETAVMNATVLGLNGLGEPASMVIVNHDPGTISLAGGSVQHVVIQPGEASGGTFTLTRTLTGVKGGSFDITVAVNILPSAVIPVDGITGRAVDRWSNAQRVPVSEAARSLIISGVQAARPQLDQLLAPQLGFRADAGTVLDWLVREYCFALRDRQLAAEGLLGFRRSAPRITGNAFAPQNPGSPAPRAVSLEASDVSRSSFSQFIAQLLARLTPSDPLGSLVVTSRPDRLPIAIDQVQSAASYTTGTFVLSVGKHTVKVGSCTQSVTVNPNQQATMSCPP
jgi:hypothetical protein